MDLEIKENNIYCSSAEKVLAAMEDNFIDLTVTSPPYDNLRKYKGFDFDVNEISRILFNKTRPGGVCVWVVGDQVVDGSETGTSFRHALEFIAAGWKLHDTMIYERSAAYPSNKNSGRYTQDFEYMFVFSKGKPKTSDLICDKKNKYGNIPTWGKTTGRNKDGNLVEINAGKRITPEYSVRNNIWRYNVGFGGSTRDDFAFKHPAIMPEALAADHIKTWSKENEIVFDPFGGSGTTPKMAIKLNRKFIAAEISKEYFEIMSKRVNNEKMKLNLFNQ